MHLRLLVESPGNTVWSKVMPIKRTPPLKSGESCRFSVKIPHNSQNPTLLVVPDPPETT